MNDLQISQLAGSEDVLEIAEAFGFDIGVVYDDVAGTLWERVAMEYDAAKGSERSVVGYGDDQLSWVGRMYSDDELGKLDGPGRYVNWADMAGIRPKSNKARTAKGSMTKRQRKAARKAERKAKRLAAKAARTQDEFFAELVTVEILA